MNKDKSEQFRLEIAGVINKYSQENESDTPDFILARYLQNCLDAFNIAVTDREGWYGRLKTPCSEPYPSTKARTKNRKEM